MCHYMYAYSINPWNWEILIVQVHKPSFILIYCIQYIYAVSNCPLLHFYIIVLCSNLMPLLGVIDAKYLIKETVCKFGKYFYLQECDEKIDTTLMSVQ